LIKKEKEKTNNYFRNPIVMSVFLHLMILIMVLISANGNSTFVSPEKKYKIVQVTLIDTSTKKTKESKEKSIVISKDKLDAISESENQEDNGADVGGGTRKGEATLPPVPEIAVSAKSIKDARSSFDEMFRELNENIESKKIDTGKTKFLESEDIKKELQSHARKLNKIEQPRKEVSQNNDYEKELEYINNKIKEKREAIASLKSHEEQTDYMDPVFLYQNKISQEIKRYLRIPPSMIDDECVLRLDLSRDGMVVGTEFISGSEALCEQGKRASFRAGRLPVPLDNDVFEELKMIEITLSK